jgi:hypothetical protein
MSSTMLLRLRHEAREIQRLAMLPGCEPLPVSDFQRAADYLRMSNQYRHELRGSYGLRRFN